MTHNFHDSTKAYAIALHLQSYGYDAKVNKETLTAYIEWRFNYDTFIVLSFPTWELTREFIRVQAQRGLLDV
jgi:hypothetical protein